MHFRMVETKYRGVQAASLAGADGSANLAMGREDTSVGFKTRAFLQLFLSINKRIKKRYNGMSEVTLSDKISNPGRSGTSVPGGRMG